MKALDEFVMSQNKNTDTVIAWLFLINSYHISSFSFIDMCLALISNEFISINCHPFQFSLK